MEPPLPLIDSFSRLEDTAYESPRHSCTVQRDFFGPIDLPIERYHHNRERVSTVLQKFKEHADCYGRDII